MRNSRTRSSGDLTVRGVQKLIATATCKWAARRSPNRSSKGLARDRKVLGTRVPGRAHFNLVADPAGGWKLNAGKLQGLTQGSVLTVYPPRDQQNAERPLGHVRIRRADTLDSTAVPCEYRERDRTGAMTDLWHGAAASWLSRLRPDRLRLAVDKRSPEPGGIKADRDCVIGNRASRKLVYSADLAPRFMVKLTKTSGTSCRKSRVPFSAWSN